MMFMVLHRWTIGGHIGPVFAMFASLFLDVLFTSSLHYTLFYHLRSFPLSLTVQDARQ
jgi:hypothetical protein